LKYSGVPQVLSAMTVIPRDERLLRSPDVLHFESERAGGFDIDHSGSGWMSDSMEAPASGSKNVVLTPKR